MLEVNRLYPQYNIIQERRQMAKPVDTERRSGIDRRSFDRVKMDTNLTRDIFEVKNKIAQTSRTETKTNSHETEKITFSQNIPKMAQNSLKTDQFIKTAKAEDENRPKPTPKEDSQTGALGGVLASILGGTIASAFLGIAGIGVALGIGAYFGGKFLKNAIVSHLKNK